MNDNQTPNHYATAEESAAVMRQATPYEIWLHQELDRVAPDRHEMGNPGDAAAMTALLHDLIGKVLTLADQTDVVLTIERKSIPPWAMGRANYVVGIRPKREAT